MAAEADSFSEVSAVRGGGGRVGAVGRQNEGANDDLGRTLMVWREPGSSTTRVRPSISPSSPRGPSLAFLAWILSLSWFVVEGLAVGLSGWTGVNTSGGPHGEALGTAEVAPSWFARLPAKECNAAKEEKDEEGGFPPAPHTLAASTNFCSDWMERVEECNREQRSCPAIRSLSFSPLVSLSELIFSSLPVFL